MRVLVFAGNQNVIQVGIAAGEAMKDLVDEPLESLSSILQSKGHAGELEQSERHDHGREGPLEEPTESQVQAEGAHTMVHNRGLVGSL